MSTYLYRAIASTSDVDEFSGDLMVWPGVSLGRTSGYLSRSSAVNAGQRSGVDYVIVRSEPVVFILPPEVLKARRIADLREELAVLTG
jgi:hypothetical protein